MYPFYSFLVIASRGHYLPDRGKNIHKNHNVVKFIVANYKIQLPGSLG